MKKSGIACSAVLTLSLGFLVLGFAGYARAQSAQKPKTDDMGMPIYDGGRPDPIENQAWWLADSINRAEAEYFGRNHVYVSFEKLEHEHLFQGKLALKVQVGPNGELSGKLNDHFLRLMVAPDGRYYTLSIRPNVGGCGFGMFTDESGAIYTAPTLDCNE
jgi:hypothetical protein